MYNVTVIKNNKIIQQFNTDKSIADIWYAYRKQYNNIGLQANNKFSFTIYIN